MSPTQAEIIKLQKARDILLTELGIAEYHRFSHNEKVKGMRKEIKRLSKDPNGISKVGEVMLAIEGLQREVTKANRVKMKLNSQVDRIDNTLNNLPEFA